MDSTVNVFNNFYSTEMRVSASEYEVVKSYFDQYTTDEKVSKTYTDTIFVISTETDIPVMELLQTFESSDEMKINLTFAYYLNSISKNKTTLYGVTTNLRPIESVQRNIVH